MRAVAMIRDIVVDLQLKYLQIAHDIVGQSYRVRSMIEGRKYMTF